MFNERDDFDHWVKEHKFNIVWDKELMIYVSAFTQGAWMAWQAAKERGVVAERMYAIFIDWLRLNHTDRFIPLLDSYEATGIYPQEFLNEMGERLEGQLLM